MFAFHSSEFYARLPDMKMTGVAATIMFKLPVVRELFLLVRHGDPAPSELATQSIATVACTLPHRRQMD